MTLGCSFWSFARESASCHASTSTWNFWSPVGAQRLTHSSLLGENSPISSGMCFRWSISPYLVSWMPYDSSLPTRMNKGRWSPDNDNIASRTLGKSTYLSWLRYLDEGAGSQSKCIVEIFLAYWLSWYVLSSGPDDILDQFVYRPSSKSPRTRSSPWCLYTWAPCM